MLKDAFKVAFTEGPPLLMGVVAGLSFVGFFMALAWLYLMVVGNG